MNRRTFLVASSVGVSGLAFGGSARSEQKGRTAGTAKSTILFFLSGGASHIDMWDMKPKAPQEYRGPFQPIATSAPGVTLCEHLPMLAQQAHHLAMVNSIGGSVSTNDHHAGYYYNVCMRGWRCCLCLGKPLFSTTIRASGGTVCFADRPSWKPG